LYNQLGDRGGTGHDYPARRVFGRRDTPYQAGDLKGTLAGGFLSFNVTCQLKGQDGAKRVDVLPARTANTEAVLFRRSG